MDGTVALLHVSDLHLDPAGSDLLEQTGKALAEVIAQLPERPDTALVHDPRQAPPLSDSVPLVLAGHTHQRAVEMLDEDTRLNR